MEDPKNSNAPKKEETQLSNLFTINLNEFNDNVPGVTRLITPKNLISPSAPATHTATSASPTRPLSDFGVFFEFRFSKKENEYIFQQAKPHQKNSLEPWQASLFDKMVFAPETLFLKEVFQEFNFKSHPFLFDVFGFEPRFFIQIVKLHEPSHEISVFLSERSLLAQKGDFLAAIKNKSDDSSIELQIA